MKAFLRKKEYLVAFFLAATLGFTPQSCVHAGLREAQPTGSAGQAQDKVPTTFKVAAVQAVSMMGAVRSNRARLQQMVRKAAENGAKVIVLPETAISGYMSSDLRAAWQLENHNVTKGLTGISPEQIAETVPGPSTKAFASLAKELRVYLTVPLLEVDPKSGNCYNTVVLIGPNGKLLLHYRKINPWPFAECGWASKGDRGNVFIDTPCGRMSLLICYDINFEPPNLKKLGVDHLLYPIAWVDSKDSTWFEQKLPNIAKENNINIIGANWTIPLGLKADWHGYGHTLILSRDGTTLAKATSDTEEQIVYAELKIPPKHAKPQP